MVKFAVIGGSGMYQLESTNLVEEIEVPTPFGPTSDKISIAKVQGERIAFLSRHGRGHRLLPTEVPSRANIWALKSLGVEQILSISAVGSLQEEFKAGDFVVCDQLIDHTHFRSNSFFGDGIVGHVGFAEPYCPGMREGIIRVIERKGHALHTQGTLVVMEGPLFSTRAESNLHRSWGAHLIGMTALPEARLAREAEICLAIVATVTDYDCWKEAEESVTIEMVLKIMEENIRSIQEIIPDIWKELKNRGDCSCRRAAENAIMTDPAVIPYQIKRKLSLFYEKYWKKP